MRASGGIFWTGACAPGALLAILLAAAPARAGDGPAVNADDGMDVIYVTARRQVEKAQDIPVSLTSVGAAELNAGGATGLMDYRLYIPSLQVISFNPRNTSVIIRGLGANIAIVNDGVEAGVGVYVDGVLYARPAQAIFDMPDITSVEELRGPQGTLYGKNSVAGVLNINTQGPGAVFEAHGSVSGGDYGYGRFTGSVSGPLDEGGHLRARLSLNAGTRGGFFRNVLTGQRGDDRDTLALRGQLEGDLAPDTTLRLTADYAHYRSRAPIRPLSGVITVLANGQAVPMNFFQRAAAAGYTPPGFDPFARLTDTNSPVRSDMEQGGIAANAHGALGAWAWDSITAWRYWNWRPANDEDLTALSVLTQNQQANNQRQFSQELRLTSPAGATVEGSGGLFYFHERDDGIGVMRFGADAPLWLLGASNPLTQAALNGFGGTALSTPRTSSYAAYGQAVWHAPDDIDVTAGLRLTQEDKTGGYDQVTSGASIAGLAPALQAQVIGVRNSLAVPMSYSLSTSNTLPGGLLTTSWRPAPGTSLYATFSHGEKSAGLNLANLAPGVSKIVAPESVDNIELGAKSIALDGLTLAADLFWEEDRNYQTTLYDTARAVSYVANIPGVRSRGLEMDATARLWDGLSLRLSSAYTDATYVSFPNAPAAFENYTVTAGKLNTGGVSDLSGRPLPAVSKWAFALGAEYVHAAPGLESCQAYIDLGDSYRSSYYSTATLSPSSRIGATNIVNLQLGLRAADGNWDIGLWSRNLFNRRYLIAQGPVTFNTGALSALVGDPRTIGITVSGRT